MIKEIKKSWLGITFPIILLIFVVFIAIWLYWYNYFFELKNQKLETRISYKNEEINKIKEDKNIQVYSLILDNKKTLDKLENNSDISKFIDGLIYIKNNYYLRLEWFNYSNWTVTTKATVDSERVWNAYVVVSSFIKKYRKDEKAIFDLSFIPKIVWNSDIFFNLKLEVKK